MLSFLPCLHTCQSVRLASCLFPGGVPGSTRPRYQGKRSGLGEPLEALVLTSPLKENPHSDSSEQMAAPSSTVRDMSALLTACLTCFAIFVPSKGPSSCRGRPGSWPYLGKQGTGSKHRASGLCYGQMITFNPCNDVHGWDIDLGLISDKFLMGFSNKWPIETTIGTLPIRDFQTQLTQNVDFCRCYREKFRRIEAHLSQQPVSKSHQQETSRKSWLQESYSWFMLPKWKI